MGMVKLQAPIFFCDVVRHKLLIDIYIMICYNKDTVKKGR